MQINHLALTLALQLLITLPAFSAALNLPPTQTNTTASSGLHPLTAQQPLAPSQLHKPQTTHIPIPLSASLTIVINYLGSPIPTSTAEENLYYGIRNVRRFLQNQSNDPLRRNRWSFGDLPGFMIVVVADEGSSLTYAQLFAVLEGLRGFMLGGEKKSRNLQFDVEVEGKGKVGFGLVWHELSSSTGVRSGNSSSMNATSFQLPTANSSLPNSSLPLVVAASQRQIVPIPGTAIILVVDFYGAPIPPAEYDKAFAASNLEIIEWFGHHSSWPIPHGRYEYDDSDVHIVVVANRGVPITWLQLFQILQGVHGFVTGDPPHYQILHYEIYKGLEIIGFGWLWYDDTAKTQVSAATS